MKGLVSLGVALATILGLALLVLVARACVPAIRLPDAAWRRSLAGVIDGVADNPEEALE